MSFGLVVGEGGPRLRGFYPGCSASQSARRPARETEESASLVEGKGVREVEAPEGPPCEAAGYSEVGGREGRQPEKFAEIRVRQVQNSPGLDS